MKEILAFCGALMVATSMFAASATFHLNANVSTSLFTNGLTMSQIVVANTNAALNSYIILLDNGVGSPTNVIGAYSNYTLSTISSTNIYTNYFGVPTTNIYNVVTNTIGSVAAVTNFAPTILSFVALSNATTVLQFNGRALLGIVATNTASADITFTYRQ